MDVRGEKGNAGSVYIMSILDAISRFRPPKREVTCRLVLELHKTQSIESTLISNFH